MNPFDDIAMDQPYQQPGSRPPPKMASLFESPKDHSCKRTHTMITKVPVNCTTITHAETMELSFSMHKLQVFTWWRKVVCLFQVSFKMVSTAQIENQFIMLFFKVFFMLQYVQEASDQESVEFGLSACIFSNKMLSVSRLER